MVGYPESLTDPSYRGQILVLTYPLIGNYGVPSTEEADENGLLRFVESDRVHVSALVVGNYDDDYSHWRAVRSLGDWLKAQNVPAIHGVDTRALTKRLRTHGVKLGKVVLKSDPLAAELPFEDPNLRNLVAEGATRLHDRAPCPSFAHASRWRPGSRGNPHTPGSHPPTRDGALRLQCPSSSPSSSSLPATSPRREAARLCAL